MRFDYEKDGTVLYMRCPHCGKGWYAPIKNYELEKDEDGTEHLKSLVVAGWHDTDITKEILCLNCEHKYTPIYGAVRMDEFVARALITVKGS